MILIVRVIRRLRLRDNRGKFCLSYCLVKEKEEAPDWEGHLHFLLYIHVYFIQKGDSKFLLKPYVRKIPTYYCCCCCPTEVQCIILLRMTHVDLFEPCSFPNILLIIVCYWTGVEGVFCQQDYAYDDDKPQKRIEEEKKIIFWRRSPV